MNKKDHILYGTTRLLQREKELALMNFDKAVELAPDCPETCLLRGKARSFCGMKLEAAKDFDNAMKLSPDDSVKYSILCSRAHVKMELYFEGLFLKSDYKGELKEFEHGDEEALQDYQKAIELKPEFAEAYIGRGKAKIKFFCWEEAVNDLSKAIELEPDNGDIYHSRGDARFEQKEYGLAIADYDEALRLKVDKDELDIIIRRAYSKYLLGRIEEAKKEIKASKFYNNELLDTEYEEMIKEIENG